MGSTAATLCASKLAEYYALVTNTFRGVNFSVVSYFKADTKKIPRCNPKVNVSQVTTTLRATRKRIIAFIPVYYLFFYTVYKNKVEKP